MSCPICKKEPATDYKPFCSRRCADVDLGRWLTESYSLPEGDEDVNEIAPTIESSKPPLHH
ncbi:MAG: DNA gyrase inhibitor YacG [Boseongicola sp.]|nr:MAG: DNA gyrase inhibitor YacG [Boseongicola sp.]